MGPGHGRVPAGTARCQLTGSVPQLMHPVLESLRGTDRQWLIDTLYAFNSGNVEQFQTLKAAWGQQVSPGRAACACLACRRWGDRGRQPALAGQEAPGSSGAAVMLRPADSAGGGVRGG